MSNKRDMALAKKITSLASSGKPTAEIAEAIGSNSNAVRAYCRKWDIKRERRSIAAQKIRDRCVELRGKVSARDIATELGITRNAVIGHWNRARKVGQIVEAS